MSESLKFGYNAGIPAGVTTAWGCRAIVQQGYPLDIPPDRESGFGHWKSLLGYLRDVDGDAWIRKASRMLATRERTEQWSDGEVTLFEDARAAVKANPLRSFGYLYVCAFYKPEPDPPMDPDKVRAKIAALFGQVPKPNRQSRVDYADPRVRWLADVTAADLVRAHNEGDDSVDVALLLEIGDEEGWS